MLTIFLATFLSWNWNKCSCDSSATVNTTSGLLTGNYTKTEYGDLFMFCGVPYAEPPIGNLRFREPVVASYQNAVDATQFGSECIQKVSNDDKVMAGSEDCLFLNIFSPNLQAQPPLPVLVFVHGGGYTDGSGSRNIFPTLIAKQFLQRGVILVTLNYRLNVFGFLNANNSELPANIGMKDQIMAFKWVQLNIGKFGGDPSRVTIQGQSAGASSVGLHIYSPLSKGLFNQVIMESGSAFAIWAMNTNDYNMVYDRSPLVADKLGCKLSDSNCLRSKSAEEIHQADLLAAHSPLPLMMDWAPILDGAKGFMPDFPGNINSQRSSVKILAGTNHDEFPGEGLSYGAKNTSVFNKTFFEKSLNAYVNQMTFGNATQIAQEEITSQYCGGRTPFNTSNWEDWLNATCQAMTNYCVNYGVRKEIEEALKHNASTKVYLYSFDYASPSFMWTRLWPGVLHGTELPFVFGFSSTYSFFLPGAKFAQSDEDVAGMFSKAFTNFAKTGDPNNPDVLNRAWNSVASIDYMPYYAIDSVSSSQDNYHYADYQFFKMIQVIRRQYRDNPSELTTTKMPSGGCGVGGLNTILCAFATVFCPIAALLAHLFA